VRSPIGTRRGTWKRAAPILAALSVASFAGIAAASSNGVGREQARLGPWSASFTYVKPVTGLAYSKLHLTVRDGATVKLDTAVRSSERGASQLGPGGFSGHPSVVLRDLTGDGIPEVLLSLYTGGAHCCFLQQVYDVSGAPARKTEIDFADAGSRLEILGGRPVFRSADESFAYVFTDFADSGAPVELWRYQAHRFVDVTREYPATIAKDAASWCSAYRTANRRKGDVRGLLAAWAADEALLHRAAAAKQTLLQLAANGTLDRGLEPPKGLTYVRSLWRLLAHDGYLG
jgi:hypothetical protein